MGFQLLDLILIGIMLISGVLALARGFTREVLSLVAWVSAALAGYFAWKSEPLMNFARQYIQPDLVAQIVSIAVVSVVVLIVVSVITIKISDYVVDSSAGAFDRTLGFVYGLARGLVLVAIAYLFYGWLLTSDQQEVWVRDAKSLPLIKTVGEKLCTLMPPDVCKSLTDTALSESADSTPLTETKSEPEPSYQNNTTQGLDNLIQGTGESTQQPGFGQDESQ